MTEAFKKDRQYYRFCAYGFLKNLRFFDAFILLFFRQSGLSFTQIGSIYALREIVTNITEIPSGITSDTLGRKRTLALSLLLYITAFAILYLGSTYPYFLTGFSLLGIADAFRSGTHKGMIMQYLKHNHLSDAKISYYGHTRSYSQMGSALSALFAGGIVFAVGDIRWIFIASIIPYVINLLNVASYPSYLDFSTARTQPGIGAAYKQTLRHFITLIRRPYVFGIIQSSSLFSAWIKSTKDYVQIVLVHLSGALPLILAINGQPATPFVIGAGYFLLFLAGAVGSRSAGWFGASKPYINAQWLLFAGLGIGAVSGLFYRYGLWSGLFLLFTLSYLIENIRKPLLTGVLSDAVPNAFLTSILSAQSLIKTLWAALLALAMGYLTDAFGMGTALAVLASGLLLMTLTLQVFGAVQKRPDA